MTPQAVDHPYLVVYSKTAMERLGLEADSSGGEQVCGLCHDTVENPVVSCHICLRFSWFSLFFSFGIYKLLANSVWKFSFARPQF